ncbi:MAG: hypothetical protein KDB23_19785 [Planctomycetales bacterium]|nr:hypothetical protein [Planctomycetales bacterium]
MHPVTQSLPPQLTAFLERQSKLLRDNLLIWAVPTVLFGSLGTMYALVRPSTWIATRGLLVREEAVGELNRSGRFDTSDARKAAQETITEVARNRQVVIGALKQLLAAHGYAPDKQPNESDISALLDGISVTAPKGAELGQSDVIYLNVKGSSADEAVQLNQLVGEQLKIHLSNLRNSRTKSVIQELTEKLRLTQANLNEATQRLEEMEREAGSDLGELRTLSQTGTGESNLRTALTQIKNDLRSSKAARTTQTEQLEFLRNAQSNPEVIIATPNRLLESQAALRRLKDGLVDAQLRVADLLGKMNSSHPRVRAAQAAEAEIRQNLHEELETAIRGVQAEITVTDALIATHEKQLADVQKRLTQLASMRARYENLVADVQDRNSQVKESQRALANARASLEASEKSSLITFVDRPDPGQGPVGPGRLMLMMAAWFGGLSCGLGCFFLLTQGAPVGGVFGRRSSDQTADAGRTAGRRSSDLPSVASPPSGRRAADRVEPAPTPEKIVPRRRAEDPASFDRRQNSPPFPTFPVDPTTQDNTGTPLGS